MNETKRKKTKTTRPGSVVVAGWCAILAFPLILGRLSLLAVSGGLQAAIEGASGDPALWATPEGIEILVVGLLVPIAIVSLVAGIAILSLKRWAWVVLMMFLAAALVLNLIRAYVHEPEYSLMLIYALLALVLNQPEVRTAFRIGRPADEPVE
jgi:hypothetical protein